MEVNWFVNTTCNLDCPYCFRDRHAPNEDLARMTDRAHMLIDGGATRVTIGGGEPLLHEHLEETLRILKEGNIFISLHTNGTRLIPRLERLAGLVDILSLPLDSTQEDENVILRGRPYLKLIDRIQQAASPAFILAYKTVATQVNADSIPLIHNVIDRTPFAYWKVYQYRPLHDGTRYRTLCDISDERFDILARKLSAFDDSRIITVDRLAGHQPYLFLDNAGRVSTIHPIDERNVPVGNITRTPLTELAELIAAMHRTPIAVLKEAI